eukprot:TRINITY_DN8882_c0_g1_i1.p1 TRINITY_DN8882_c0_g1~~TRINITY_DN8882_c0_g1_i1.p1  ORF type:complete len:516 (+),score=127.62 TRINITY_DN8882_c0_g1_i1:105-1652(+)
MISGKEAPLLVDPFSSLHSYLNWTVVSLVTTILYGLWAFFWVHRWRQNKLPGPFLPLPFFGPLYLTLKHILVDKKKGLAMLDERNEKFGPTWAVKPLGRPATIMSSDPVVCDYILKTNFENYIKGPFLVHQLEDLFGQGIFNTNFGNWKRQRQIASHMFKLREMKHYVDTFNEHAGTLIDRLEGTTEGTPVDMQDMFSRFTLDSIGEIAFGININSLLNEDVPFAKAFNAAQLLTAERFRNPAINWLGRFRSIWTSERLLKEKLSIIDRFAYEIIRVRRDDPRLEDKSDLLSRYMCSKDENGLPFSDKYLRDIILNFMIAGRDTTAATLSFLFHSLSQNPRVEAKLIAEIDEKLQNRLPDYDSVKSMPYLSAAVDETLRLFPPVPVDIKTAVEDDVLPNGMRVPKGANVGWAGYGLGRSSVLWESPLEFRPERWLDVRENGGKVIAPINFIPFQSGPRVCLGMSLAYLETKIAAIRVLQRIHLRQDPDHTVILVPGLTLVAGDGVKMYVERRSNL